MKRMLLCLIPVVALAADLPVKEVVLYKHGVGFFERSGSAPAGETVRLDFDAAEMNDVLKSLTVTERGGKISGIRYDSQDPLGRRLSQFPFEIGGAQPLAVMLDQLKGARLEMKIGAESVAGVIVTARLAPGGEKQAEREYVSLMMDSGDLRMFDLSAASSIRFPDAKLQQQFKDYLSAVASARSKDKRSVYIDSTATGPRELVASYMIPAAVWKSSYRLIFGTAGQPTLEGWAIVDNTTGEDWNKIQLSLVSGRPISFVSQLYAPKYVQRPTAELPDDQAARPVIHEGAFEAQAKTAAAPAPALARGGAMGSGGGIGSGVGGGAFRSDMAMAPREIAPSSVNAVASGAGVGELFEYRITEPVTIRGGGSAMLPFLQQPIAARKLLIYSNHGSQNPTNAAELTNNSGKTLDGGPVTVYDGGAYGGEALVETLRDGDKRLISYAVDLGTRVTEAFGSKQAIVREVHASRGLLTTKLAAEETRTYTIRNVDQKAKTLIIEHPLRPNYTLLNQKPLEKTSTAYRFEVQLAPGASQEFPVSEERVYDQSYSVINLTPDAILEYVRNRTLSDAARKQLQAIAAQKTQISENDRALAAAQKDYNDVSADEDRIRRNIQSLNAVSGQQQQVQNYAKQIDAAEQQLASLRDRQAELQKKKTALESELNRLLESLAF
jgi:hypothetical protein